LAAKIAGLEAELGCARKSEHDLQQMETRYKALFEATLNGIETKRKQADEMLYRAKREGRDRIESWPQQGV